MKKYQSFAEFYPFYLSQHQNRTCRRLHFIGSSLILLLIFYCINYSHWQGLWFIPFIGYGFAWLGHFIFEKNKPATFTYPIYSLVGDWVMFTDILTRKIKF
ncbi:DUF962 domain-containing protein [Colwellia sp. MB3u-28]|uniref:DUF962 domain-containing protein n=1 Tax=unclassified Colwellia TaxID=196834 RepID=UPI0015F764EA|nr:MULTISPECIES: DUF962 domain-containing protein [unclassified Colwellia]MBA6254810.1 DUF962 domain-containing protein [Colwellia sp. MB3u-28]MBA6259872.1 DUF962 domain-containing protein [Colwellia sp. MB3u-41]MBA6234234.1 DUF962 domain-containing protein [Colwellia sp. MB02u-7]MBA6237837.1 DUF962 domain-containing protein [Colwellia sp. MB02u-11]MBA6300912.1 DUF962 domain-containing protein [Colwellia sp. MB3u-22]